MLKLLTVVLIGASFFEIVSALPQIAAHAPAAAAAPVTAVTLWMLLGIQVFISVAFLIVPFVARRSPGSIHFGTRRFSQYSPQQRERILPLLSKMVGLQSVVLNLLCALGIRWIAGTSPAQRSPTPVLLSIGAFLVVFCVITFYYLDRFDDEAGPPDAQL